MWTPYRPWNDWQYMNSVLSCFYLSHLAQFTVVAVEILQNILRSRSVMNWICLAILMKFASPQPDDCDLLDLMAYSFDPRLLCWWRTGATHSLHNYAKFFLFFVVVFFPKKPPTNTPECSINTSHWSTSVDSLNLMLSESFGDFCCIL